MHIIMYKSEMIRRDCPLKKYHSNSYFPPKHMYNVTRAASVATVILTREDAGENGRVSKTSDLNM